RRRAVCMQRGIMVAQLEREAIRKTARLTSLLGRQRPAGERDAEILAVGCGRVRAPGDLDLRLAREGTRRSGQRELEAVERRLVGQILFLPNPRAGGGLRPRAERQWHEVPACAGTQRAERVDHFRIVCPVFAQSARNPSMPLSVSTCLKSPRITLGGIVATSAPIRALSSTCVAWRTDATRISVSNR